MTSNNERADSRDAPWPERPWIMALLCAAAGLAFYLFVRGAEAHPESSWRVVGATFVAVSTLSFVMTVEWRRAGWAVAFAVVWGLIVGLVSWSTHNYAGRGEVMSFPFLAAIFAVLLACPLFQTARDEGAWRFPSGSVHNHVWTDAVIGAASLAFVGITFLLVLLVAGLFQLIGIELLMNLLEEGEFDFALAGFAFGGAVGMLRERDALVATMQRLVIVVLGVLAPVLAGALILFLVSLPLTGLVGLWDGWVSAAALTLTAAAGGWVLINAALGLGDDDTPVHRVLHWSALALALVVLPLAGLAMTAIVLRVGQYGWTPERPWAVVCAAVAIAYGVAGWWAVARGRMGFAPLIRTLQTRLALGVCELAVILSLPIVDFGAIATRDQIARLRSGATKLADFDFAAMAFDFGPAGRAALRQMARSGPAAQRAEAAAALAADNRWDVARNADEPLDARPLAERLRIIPEGRAVPAGAMTAIGSVDACRRGYCVALWVDDDQIALLSQPTSGSYVRAEVVTRNARSIWNVGERAEPRATNPERPDLSTANITITERTQRQISVDGRVVHDIVDPPAR